MESNFHDRDSSFAVETIFSIKPQNSQSRIYSTRGFPTSYFEQPPSRSIEHYSSELRFVIACQTHITKRKKRKETQHF